MQVVDRDGQIRGVQDFVNPYLSDCLSGLSEDCNIGSG